ncbi:hypothetical protein C1T30_43765, partial [Bacillus sp. MBGLi97]
GTTNIMHTQLLTQTQIHNLIIFKQPSLHHKKPTNTYVNNILLETEHQTKTMHNNRELSIQPSPR